MEFKEILEAAIRAPSGDNCQPWRFAIQGNEILVFNVPEKDTSLFNYRQRASLIALGALLENARIAAVAYGCSPEISLLPDSENEDLVARIVLSETAPKSDPLFPCIEKRCTNRKRYRPQGLTPDMRTDLLGVADGFEGVKLHLLEGDKQTQAAEIISLNDRLVFENHDLHEFLFEHIRWSDQEASATRDGLDIKTLELAFPDSIAFGLLKNWELVRMLNMFGISRIIAANARKLACSAAAIGVVTISDSGPKDYLRAGQLMERVWLEATRLGLSFQLMTGITFLMQRVEEGEPASLSQAHCGLVGEARKKLLNICGAGSAVPAVMFRVGLSEPPTTYSLRLPWDV